MTLLRLGSSWREIPVAEARERAWRAATAVGVTRVTEITRLDFLDVPVAVGVRPRAAGGGLCVSAGKGLTRDDSYVGAMMEAVELAFAEPGRARVAVIDATAQDVLDGRKRRGAIADFGLPQGVRVDLDAPLPTVWAEDLASGRSVLVPAEAVFFPFRHPRAFFGSDTNGLASGSSVAEATLHGLLEVIERDAYAFALAGTPVRLDPAGLPAALGAIGARLAAHEIDAWWFALPNPFGVAAVAVSLHDRHDPRLIVGGQGAHLSPAIAAARALTEALQSRLSVIHGGRDDLEHLFVKRPVMSWEDARTFAAREHAEMSAGPPPLAVSALPHRGDEAPTIPAAIELLRARLAAAGLRWVLRVVLTPADFPMQVVRVVVPGLEQPGYAPRRCGPRMQAWMRGGFAYP